MSHKQNGVNYSRDTKTVRRRNNVIDRLENQLTKGTKVIKDRSSVPLTEGDIKRINKEIETLKTRI